MGARGRSAPHSNTCGGDAIIFAPKGFWSVVRRSHFLFILCLLMCVWYASQYHFSRLHTKSYSVCPRTPRTTVAAPCTDSMGAMGAIAPCSKTFGGDAIIFPPQVFGVWGRSHFLFMLCLLMYVWCASQYHFNRLHTKSYSVCPRTPKTTVRHHRGHGVNNWQPDKISSRSYCFFLLRFLWPPYGIGQAIILLPCCFFMAALWNRQAIIFLPCGYYLSFYLSIFVFLA